MSTLKDQLKSAVQDLRYPTYAFAYNALVGNLDGQPLITDPDNKDDLDRNPYVLKYLPDFRGFWICDRRHGKPFMQICPIQPCDVHLGFPYGCSTHNWKIPQMSDFKTLASPMKLPSKDQTLFGDGFLCTTDIHKIKEYVKAETGSKTDEQLLEVLGQNSYRNEELGLYVFRTGPLSGSISIILNGLEFYFDVCSRKGCSMEGVIPAWKDLFCSEDCKDATLEKLPKLKDSGKTSLYPSCLVQKYFEKRMQELTSKDTGVKEAKTEIVRALYAEGGNGIGFKEEKFALKISFDRRGMLRVDWYESQKFIICCNNIECCHIFPSVLTRECELRNTIYERNCEKCATLQSDITKLLDPSTYGTKSTQTLMDFTDEYGRPMGFCHSSTNKKLKDKPEPSKPKCAIKTKYPGKPSAQSKSKTPLTRSKCISKPVQTKKPPSADRKIRIAPKPGPQHEFIQTKGTKSRPTKRKISEDEQLTEALENKGYFTAKCLYEAIIRTDSNIDLGTGDFLRWREGKFVIYNQNSKCYKILNICPIRRRCVTHFSVMDNFPSGQERMPPFPTNCSKEASDEIIQEILCAAQVSTSCLESSKKSIRSFFQKLNGTLFKGTRFGAVVRAGFEHNVRVLDYDEGKSYFLCSHFPICRKIATEQTCTKWHCSDHKKEETTLLPQEKYTTKEYARIIRKVTILETMARTIQSERLTPSSKHQWELTLQNLQRSGVRINFKNGESVSLFVDEFKRLRLLRNDNYKSLCLSSVCCKDCEIKRPPQNGPDKSLYYLCRYHVPGTLDVFALPHMVKLYGKTTKTRKLLEENEDSK